MGVKAKYWSAKRKLKTKSPFGGNIGIDKSSDGFGRVLTYYYNDDQDRTRWINPPLSPQLPWE